MIVLQEELDLEGGTEHLRRECLQLSPPQYLWAWTVSFLKQVRWVYLFLIYISHFSFARR